jgi:threonine dehydratase
MHFDSKEAAAEVKAAENRIRSYIIRTPLEPSLYLDKATGGEIHLKLENMQYSGSFKLRGAVNKILSLREEGKSHGLITASSGNHGAAFSWAAKKFGLTGIICVPETISTAKLEILKLYGMDIRLHGDDCIKAERFAKHLAEEEGKTFISPYNDPFIIGGQGTVAVELIQELGDVDSVLVPVGGGGLISGIAAYLKAINPRVEIIGCQPDNSKVMYLSLEAGRILDIPSLPTLSDGTAGGIEQGSVTFDICRELVDDFIMVSEDEIKNALMLIMEKHALLVEGAAALPVASLLQQADRFRGKTAALIISGGKISLETLRSILL